MRSVYERFKAHYQNKKDKENIRLKKELCQAAVKTQTCPNNCNICAWNTREVTN